MSTKPLFPMAACMSRALRTSTTARVSTRWSIGRMQSTQAAHHQSHAQINKTKTFEALVASHTQTVTFSSQNPITTRSALMPSESHRANNFTSTTIAGPGMIDPPPFVFTDEQSGSVLAFYRLGKRLAGHGGIVHGGVSAALLDECMFRACCPRLAGKLAVTANLTLDYKSPIPVESTILLRATTTAVEGRKAWVEATIEDAEDGRLLVVAKGLFIEPKWASELSSIY